MRFNWTKSEIAVTALSVIAASIIASIILWPSPPSFTDTLVEEYQVERVFSGDGWCTIWSPTKDGKVLVSADHCREHTDDASGVEPIHMTRGQTDGVIYGDRHRFFPRGMVVGESVFIVGYPAGADSHTVRRGVVYLVRSEPSQPGYSGLNTIIKLTDPDEPVVGGMSGGAVFSGDGEPLAILVTVNGPADLDQPPDGKADHSVDVVPLADLWTMVD